MKAARMFKGNDGKFYDPECLEAIQVFKTVDGKVFQDRDKAKEHEAKIEAYDRFKKLLTTSAATGRWESAIREILECPGEVAEILLTLRKKLPRSTAEESAKAA